MSRTVCTGLWENWDLQRLGYSVNHYLRQGGYVLISVSQFVFSEKVTHGPRKNGGNLYSVASGLGYYGYSAWEDVLAGVCLIVTILRPWRRYALCRVPLYSLRRVKTICKPRFAGQLYGCFTSLSHSRWLQGPICRGFGGSTFPMIF